MRRRLLFSYLSLTLFVLIALGVPLGLSYASTERRRLQHDVERDAFSLAQRAGGLGVPTDSGAKAELNRAVRQYEQARGAHVTVVGADGVVLAPARDSGETRSDSELNAARRGREVSETRDDARYGDVLVVTTPVFSDGTTNGAVRIMFPRGAINQRIERNWLLLGGLGGVISLVVLLVSTLFAQSLTRPLAALDAAASRLGEGDLKARVPVPNDPPELRGLSVSFNATAARLEALVRSQQAFVTDASHQLRTPLAALRLRLENLEAEAPQALAEDLDHSLAEVHRLSRLVDGLLVLARAEGTGVTPEPVHLAEVVEGRRDAWAAFADERAVMIRAEAEPLVVRSVPGRLEQELDNLLNNALEVAPRASEVVLSVRRVGDDAVIEVRDQGPGMGPEQQARAFDRFWRGEGAAREHAGFGLGLPIVRQLARADGGDVALIDLPRGGLAVQIRLPLVGESTRAATARRDVVRDSGRPGANAGAADAAGDPRVPGERVDALA